MIVVLDNLRSALNVGSIIRTCDAFGIKDVYFCGITPYIDNKRVLKTSLGAEKNIEAKEEKSTLDLLQKLKKKKMKILGLEISEESIPIYELKNKEKAVLVIGNEVSGINPSVLGMCDEVIKIPMRGVKESLNVSVAFGIAAFYFTKNTCQKKSKE